MTDLPEATWLARAPLHVEGRVFGASNATLRCITEDGAPVIYKPQRGERPLWDFPEGTITGREIAAYAIDQALGTSLVPPTTWREDGPAGPGMCQAWVNEDEAQRLVDVVSPGRIPRDWIPILQAQDSHGAPVVLVHADNEALQRMAVLDAVLNNGDRKGGHVITDVSGRLWGVDHGVTLSVDPKLRTVLWGWADQPLPVSLLEQLTSFLRQLEEGQLRLDRWLDPAEQYALTERTASLAESRRFPIPSEDWPAIPWPVF